MDAKKITPKFTMIFLALILLIGIGYDVWAMIKGGREASISHWVITKSYEMPFMVFITGNLLGIIEGHLFWRMRGGSKETDKIDSIGEAK